ncbi:MAG TPA: FG-GAP-like repeat-containing protein, partial [Gemmatimonadales bacterium]|nr:FG-GAP-like repeat-containing protein [Gemmatimonadales bacterium]
MKLAGIISGLLLLGATGAAAQQPTAMAVYDSAGHRMDYPFLGGLDHPRPQLVDIDGDGDLDLFVQEYTGRMMFFENTGRPDSAAFTWRTNQYQGLDVGEWSRFVDVDGDGDLDLFAESPFSYIRVFRNDGSKQKARFVTATDTLHDAGGTAIFSDRQNIPQIADIDCNSRLDLLLGRASGMVTRYEETGRDQSGLPQFKFVTDSFQGIQIIGQQFNNPGIPGGPGSMHGANTMIVTDLDRDGDPDILWGDYFEAGLLWLVNSGSCAHPVIGRDSVQFPANAPLRTSGYNAPAVADLDGDGDLDVMVGVLGGAYNPDQTARANLYYLEQTAPHQWTLRTTQFLSMIDVGSESSPALAD